MYDQNYKIFNLSDNPYLIYYIFIVIIAIVVIYGLSNYTCDIIVSNKNIKNN